MGSIRSRAENGVGLDLDPMPGQQHRGHLHHRGGGANLCEDFGMGARDEVGVGHVLHIGHGAHDVANVAAGLAQRLGDDGEGGARLSASVLVLVARRRAGAGDMDLIAIVRTREGQEAWAFSTPRYPGQWWLHGWFA